MNQEKANFVIGLLGASVGILVSLLVIFMNFLSNLILFYAFSFVFIVAILVLMSTSIFLFKILPGFMKSISIFPLLGVFQILNGIPFFLGKFDENGIIFMIEPYLEFDIFLIMGICFIVGFVPFVFSMLKIQYTEIFLKEKILKTGIKTTAKINVITDTNIKINGRRQYKLELEINHPKFGKYIHTISTYISILQIETFKVGNKINIVIDKKNKNRVFIDFKKIK